MKNLDLNIFPKIDKDLWLQLAEKQLKGENPSEKLAWQNDAGLHLQGYYDSSDIEELNYLSDFFSAIESHRWKLYEVIGAKSPAVANKQAVDALMGGCDGIIISDPNENDIDTILKEVDDKICDVSIISATDPGHNSRFTGFQIHPNGNCVASLDPKNPVDQIVELLQAGKNKSHVYRAAFSDFFLEISTVRALRYLMTENGYHDIQVHSHVPLHSSDEHQWFLNTTAGLASILGGSHSINFSTASGDSRISRNTGNLIREESGIVTYSDQCGGSYYVEALTDQIIKECLKR